MVYQQCIHLVTLHLLRNYNIKKLKNYVMKVSNLQYKKQYSIGLYIV